jgi:hypothetical protein
MAAQGAFKNFPSFLKQSHEMMVTFVLEN